MGWGEFLGAIGKIINALPIQGRIERLKNELDRLKKEREAILGSKATKEAAKKLSKILIRIEEINQLLKNYSKD